MAHYYVPVEKIVGSLVYLFKQQENVDAAKVLESAEARIEEAGYDNWNGGTEIFTLLLEVPLKLFSKIESKSQEIEWAIEKKLEKIVRKDVGQSLNTVSISPRLEAFSAIKKVSNSTEEDNQRIWKANLFRLFISHVSSHKVPVNDLKERLSIYGVSGFVAHKDIEPTQEWLNEIELALGSADALVALLTKDFHTSKWTDQEVGIILGQGGLVIPVDIGCSPYGFMSKRQALPGSFEKIDQLAFDIVEVLLRQRGTSEKMREEVTVAFEKVESFLDAKKVSNLILATNGFSGQQLDRFQQACERNSQVSNSYGVPEKITTYISKFKSKVLVK